MGIRAARPYRNPGAFSIASGAGPVSGRGGLAADRARVLAQIETLVGGLAHEAVARPAGELGADDELRAQPLGVAGSCSRRRRRERWLVRGEPRDRG